MNCIGYFVLYLHSSGNIFMQLKSSKFPSGVCGFSIGDIIRSGYCPTIFHCLRKYSFTWKVFPFMSQCKYEKELKKECGKTTWQKKNLMVKLKAWKCRHASDGFPSCCVRKWNMS
ncbi:hypothetical protein AMECASPLE_011639 [Ameca splendens]|uniref:Uncharacterized protein n=1 Tax=Ameca splendens TaxID=208324 RepID=A0ABV1A891_9TELE